MWKALCADPIQIHLDIFLETFVNISVEIQKLLKQRKTRWEGPINSAEN
jgi:hypothetical protein